MPSEITHKAPFRLQNYVIALVVTFAIGYVVGLNHQASASEPLPEPRRTVHVTPAP